MFTEKNEFIEILIIYEFINLSTKYSKSLTVVNKSECYK